MMFHRARYVDNMAGRFISEDPMRFRSLSVNLLAYASNDPIGLTDPSGFDVVNNSDHTIYVKPEVGPVGSYLPVKGNGGSYTGPQDGIWDPSIPNQVFKVTGKVHMTISVYQINVVYEGNGCGSVSGSPGAVAKQQKDGGWKPQTWIDDKVSNGGWSEFVEAAKNAEASSSSQHK